MKMFCSNCGTQLPDGTKYCTNCGSPVDTGEIKGFTYNADANYNDTQNSASGDYSSNPGNDSFQGDAAGGFTYNQQQNVMPLKTDRSLLLFVLLTIITCGIYQYVFIYQLVHDVNIACDGDGDETPGLLMFILLGMVTCGIYCLYWYYRLGNRLATNAARYGYSVTENGTTVLLWIIIGWMLCYIGPIIAWNIIINNTNTVCMGYNRAHGVA